jgi:hypothetical protein
MQSLKDAAAAAEDEEEEKSHSFAKQRNYLSAISMLISPLPQAD